MDKKRAYFLGVVLFLICGVIYAQGEKSEANKTPQETPLVSAEALIDRGDLTGAEKILLGMVQKMPSNWKPVDETRDPIVVYSWDSDEFRSYARYFGPQKNKKIAWIRESYSKAYFDLAYIAIEQKNFQKALQYLDEALSLEPDQVRALCEKAYIIAEQKHYQEAYDLYMKAVNIREWASDKQRATALRGAGTVLIDLGKLDEAEAMLKKSLEIDPKNTIALNELGYIGKLRKK